MSSPDAYVEVLAGSRLVFADPSGSCPPDPAPLLPAHLPVQAQPAAHQVGVRQGPFVPSLSSFDTESTASAVRYRAQAIAVFFAVAQGFGALGPTVYGSFVASGKPSELMMGYLIGAGVMAVGGLVEATIGVKAERTALEDVARPLSLVSVSAAATVTGAASAH